MISSPSSLALYFSFKKVELVETSLCYKFGCTTKFTKGEEFFKPN